MKKLVLFVMVAAGLSIFNACQKEELNVRQLADEVQPQEVVQPDIYVEGDYLVFKDFETLITLQKELDNMSMEEIQSFERKMGYESAYSYRNNLLKKADTLPDAELINYLEKVSKEGYFDKHKKEFVYPFYNESLAMVLNKKGKFKIDKTFYQFKGTNQTITADLSKMKHNGDVKTLTKVIQLDDAILPQLKSGENLIETMLRNDRLRCLLQLKREYFTVEGPIIVNGQPVWGILGYYWAVYYRFYSYKQFTLYKSDRPTYFNWKTNRILIGGDDDDPLMNYYNANPPTERTSESRAIEHIHIYETYPLTPAPGVAPDVHNVYVSDFWSDYMSYIHGSLSYPN